MVVDAVVNGVKGAASRPAEALIFLVGWVSSLFVEDIVASAAFRFRVRGGMVPVLYAAGLCAALIESSGVQVTVDGEQVRFGSNGSVGMTVGMTVALGPRRGAIACSSNVMESRPVPITESGSTLRKRRELLVSRQ